MSHYYPHLNEGIAAQFPIRRTTRYRTVVNANDLTTNLRTADPGARRIAWWLRYQGLADNEMASLQNFFRTVRGPLDSFVFLDPEANLLAHSENLTEPVWQSTAGLSVTLAPVSPVEAEQAFRLTSAPGQTAQIYQAINANASYRWALSMYARAVAGDSLTLFLRSANGEQSSTHTLESQWKRFHFGGQFWSSGTGVEVGLQLSGGASADVTAIQLETQCAPSRYKRSGSHGGIYPDARFAQDSVRFTTLAPNCHQAALIVTAPLPE